MTSPDALRAVADRMEVLERETGVELLATERVHTTAGGDVARAMVEIEVPVDELEKDVPVSIGFGDEEESDDEPDEEDGGEREERVQEEHLDHTDPDDLQRAYDEADSIAAAAERFDVGYTAVFKRMKRHGIHEPKQATEGDEDDRGDQEDSDGDQNFESVAPDWLDEASWWQAVDMADDLESLVDALGWDDYDAVDELVQVTDAAEDLDAYEAGVAA